ncbi:MULTISPECIES: endonuclease/exonuclease/phosphatase family protein [Mycobacteriaceae]|uniref:Endonuclease/exonuclease/phosphatase family protein n=1 Tax=Mycolicibacterium parafortuitum TaxID=39692 RepID=A0ACC6MED3_MYCPF|nr:MULTISPECIES: endonuclease/exonuclease/phosphatase family protein [Mycobacteriaceae]MDZ5085323.1 endonuclease/exonuclease/phosphatase family protein [Mycolicibacterium parafortuitum]
MIPAVFGRRRLTVRRFDAHCDAWVDAPSDGAPSDGAAVEVHELSVSTFNVWNKAFFAEQRYQALAGLLQCDRPDVMVFQEVTAAAQTLLLEQPWVREGYRCVGVVGGRIGGYGMLVLSRLPIAAATFSRLPSRRRRSFVQADLAVNGRTLRICSVHLESGQDGAWLRAWQLRRVFRAVSADQAVILGDFNMRDGEERWIAPAYRDVWPTLHPQEPGFTENSSTNPMLRDSKKKPRQLRFDRVLIKGADWVPTDIAMLGTEPISPELPRVFPSDHFGLRCRLRTVDPGSVTER